MENIFRQRDTRTHHAFLPLELTVDQQDNSPLKGLVLLQVCLHGPVLIVVTNPFRALRLHFYQEDKL